MTSKRDGTGLGVVKVAEMVTEEVDGTAEGEMVEEGGMVVETVGAEAEVGGLCPLD